ncbi:hypothetical protein C9374_012026 [Naegleria lovaniensis]|uniref:F-box domain-containing protein n=1 Tax=Naegleria lovaniensis TaxID=51637 RepID=A0AA88KCT0_NAELO|nr:uncharacterized protein C9374_012026 [Naegleria lovaniensis]KAG2373563.1 hypothetical protein C9374_012026 [Naegleria lovaniensis]
MKRTAPSPSSFKNTILEEPHKKVKQHDTGGMVIANDHYLLKPSIQLSFHEMIPDEVLALIFQYISDISSFSNVMLVSKHFHRVLFSVESNCFEFVDLDYLQALQMPDFDLVRRCIINDNDWGFDSDDDNDDDNNDDQDNVLNNNADTTTNEKMSKDAIDDQTMNQTLKASFPFTKLKYIKLDGFGDNLSVFPLLGKMNKTTIEHICYNNYLDEQLLQLLINEFPNLKKLEVADFSEYQKVYSSNHSVTAFKLNEVDGYATYGYSEPTNVCSFLRVLLSPCFPNLQFIEFEPVVYYVDIIDLIRLLIDPLFHSVKKLKVHVVVFGNEDFDELINRNDWKMCCELKQIPELELTCEFTNMAILLYTLFQGKTTKVQVVSTQQGTRLTSMKSLIGNIFADDRKNILKLVEQQQEFNQTLVSYASDYESAGGND